MNLKFIVALSSVALLSGCGSTPEQDGIEAAELVCACGPESRVYLEVLTSLKERIESGAESNATQAYESRSHLRDTVQLRTARCLSLVAEEIKGLRDKYATNRDEADKFDFAQKARSESCQKDPSFEREMIVAIDQVGDDLDSLLFQMGSSKNLLRTKT